MSVPFSLPLELVDSARRKREEAALKEITSSIDTTFKQGMSALESVAKGAAEQISPFAQALQNGGFTVPTLDDLTPDWIKQKQQAATQASVSTAAPSTTTTAPSAASGTPSAMPQASGGVSDAPAPDDEDDEAYIRRAAAARGIDPEIAVRVANTEGGAGREGRARQNMQGAPAYGHFQLYIGGPENGAMGDEALASGIDPRDPKQWRQAIDFALDKAKERGWQPFQGAAAAGIGDREGIGQAPAPRPGLTTPTQAEQTPAAQAQSVVATAGRFARNQGDVGKELGLPWERTIEICGPVAAAAFLRATGRNPGREEAEAMRVAQEKGYWAPGRGMGGTATEEQLLNDLGVATRRVAGAPDWRAVAADVQRGNPVIIDAGDHYMVAEAYDPETGQFDFGETAGFLTAARGRTKFRPEELPSLSGPGMTISPNAAIYLDNPTTPAPSAVAGRAPNAGGTSTPAAPPPAPTGSSPPVGATSTASIGAGDEQFGPNSMAMKTSQIGVPMPEDASIEESGAASANQPQTLPPPLRNIVPYDEQTGRTGYAEMQRAPLADGESMDPSMLPGDGGTAPQTYEQPYDPDQGPREGGRDGWNGSGGTSSEAATAPSSPPMDAGQGDSQGQYVPPVQSQIATPAASGQPPASPMASMEQDASTGISSTSVDEELAPRAAEDTRPYYGPAEPATPAIGAAQNAGATIEADQDLAPRPGILQAGADTYGQALGEVGQKHDEIAAATAARRAQAPEPTSEVDRGIRDAVWAATDALGATNRAMDIVNTVLMTTPQAGADVINAALERAGIGRSDIGVTVLGQRVGIADIVDLGPFTNIGIGRASGMAVPAGAVQYGTGVVAGGIERGASAAINAGREALGSAGSAIRRGAEAVGDAWEQGRATARRAEALDTGGGAYGTLGVSPGRQSIEGNAASMADSAIPSMPQEPWRLSPEQWQSEMARVSPDGRMPDPSVDQEAYRRWYQLDANKPAAHTPTAQTGAFETDTRLRPAIESSFLQPEDYRFVREITVEPRSELVRTAQWRQQAGMGRGETPRAKFERDGRMTFQGEILDDPKAGRTMTHEVGHSIENNLPESLLDRWKGEIHPETRDAFEYGRFLQDGGEAPPTSYAGQNWMEDFAESFTEWRQAQAEGRAPNLGPKRQQFMQDVDEWLSGGRSLERGTMEGQRYEQSRLLSTIGVSPGGGRDVWSRGVLDAASRDIGSSLGGSVFGAAAGAAMPADSDEERRQNALRGAGIGLVGGPLARRAMGRAQGALATPGITPNGPQRGARPTVEAIESRIETAYSVAKRAREMGNTAQAERAMEAVRSLESDLVDAVNARKALEPAIESDIGRRVERMPYEPDVRTDPYTTERAATADDLSGPVSIPTNRPGMQNAGLPFDPSSAAAGGAAGAMTGSEDGEEPDPWRTGLGMVIGGIMGRKGLNAAEREAWAKAIRAAAKRGGKAGDELIQEARVVARQDAMPGFESLDPVSDSARASRMPSPVREITDAPNRPRNLGDVPPSQVNQGMLPGMNPLLQPKPGPPEPFVIPPSINTPRVQRAISNAERRAENMARRGLETPSVWEWIKQAGYAGIYGPATLVNSSLGGAQELLLGQPKEAVRALVSGRGRNYAAQAGAQIRAVPEGLSGLGRVLFGSDSAETVAARSGGSQGTANLSERVVNPVGHFAARLLERPGEILTEAPDAVFRPAFMAQGMQREAGKIAAELGLRGRPAQAYADELMQMAEQLHADPNTPVASSAAHRIVDAGKAYADQLGYKGTPGAFGQWLGNMAKRDDAVGVLASFLVPFPGMAARMSEAAARSTPGIGLLPSVRRGQATKFDVIYDQAFGTAVAGGLAYWAFNGGITGSGPSDTEKRKMMMDQGWQPNSTLVGNYYIPNRVFGRFQPMLDTAGEIHDALAYGKKDQKPSEMAADLVKRGSKIAIDQTGLSGLADLHDMLTQGFASQFPGWIARSGLRYFPYAGVIRASATATDDKQRRAESWSDVGLPAALGQQASLAVPGLRQNVPAAQRVLGDDAPNPQQGLGAIIPRTTTRRNDPIIGAFEQGGLDIGAAPDKIDNIELTAAQKRRWLAVRGQSLQRARGEVSSVRSLPPAERTSELRRILRDAGQEARDAIEPTFTTRQRLAGEKKAS